MFTPFSPMVWPSVPMMPGTSLVGRVEHVLADLGVDVDALDLDEARLAVGEHRARDRPRLVLRLHDQPDVAVEDAGLVLRVVGKLDPAFPRMTGAETMLTSGSSAASARPCSAQSAP
jgi:hypothetical protein